MTATLLDFPSPIRAVDGDDLSPIEDRRVRSSAEFHAALLEIAQRSNLDLSPLFEQIDLVHCEDGGLMVYTSDRAGREYIKAFDGPTEGAEVA
jgi:hypothetical protein